MNQDQDMPDCCASPFVYPDSVHERTQSPPKFSKHSDFKPFLKIEFRQRCVYCCCPDGLTSNNENFGADHYYPKYEFGELVVEYENLLYSCNICNRKKGTYFATENEPWIVNPCMTPMADHMQFVELIVETYTEHGRHTVDLLRLNDTARIKFRQYLCSLIVSTRESLRRQLHLFSELMSRLNDARDTNSSKKAAKAIDEISKEIVQSRITLNRLCACDCAAS